ncbi:MAG: hypothetical protein KU37_11170 [Sulfuricurvum sp. PC08-66]|nr:MAG: hypothetical protein KU37_11170 [Sulfuricurvum sp. PC08-66]
MAKYEALFEDEEDIFGGTPASKYWDILGQVSSESAREEFDALLTRMAAMEQMLMPIHGEEQLDRAVQNFTFAHSDVIEAHKKSLYMELVGRLIYKLAD